MESFLSLPAVQVCWRWIIAAFVWLKRLYFAPALKCFYWVKSCRLTGIRYSVFKTLLHCPPALYIFKKKSAVVLIFMSLYITCHYSLGVFKLYPLSLFLSNFIVMCLALVFLRVWGVCVWISLSSFHPWVYSFHWIWKILSHYFFIWRNVHTPLMSFLETPTT